MLIRRERSGDVDAICAVHEAAFAHPDEPHRPVVEAKLVAELRASPAWRPELSLVAEHADVVIGHVVCSTGSVGSTPALALGPVGVCPDRQGTGVGSALMHAVLGAADALSEPMVVLLGHADYYPRFGFRLAAEYGVVPAVPEWEPNFFVRALTGYDSAVRGRFAFPPAFAGL